jgi:hypothetical protein
LEAYKLRTELLGLYSLNDPYHGWVDGHRDIVSLESKQRIMGTSSINFNLPEASEFLHLQTFPRVEIVEGLLIRRHFYRRIAVSCLGKLLRETFTGLRFSRHEGWHDVDLQQQSRFEKSMSNLHSLQKLSEDG